MLAKMVPKFQKHAWNPGPNVVDGSAVAGVVVACIYVYKSTHVPGVCARQEPADPQ